VPQVLPIASGTTAGPAGEEEPFAGWRQYAGAAGIYIDVGTYLGFDNPVYITSLIGDSWHWATTGGNSVYRTPNVPLKNGFRIYVRLWDGSPLSPQFAVDKGWRVNWIAVQSGLITVQ
jgi:hypothetical protein